MSTEQPEITHIVAVERWTLILAALLIGVGLFVLSGRAQLGLCLGAGLMVLNTWLIRRLSGRLMRAWGGQDGRRPSVGLLLFLFHFKLLLVAALLYVGMRLLPVDPLALIVGISILPVAIGLRAIEHALRPATEPTNQEG